MSSNYDIYIFTCSFFILKFVGARPPPPLRPNWFRKYLRNSRVNMTPPFSKLNPKVSKCLQYHPKMHTKSPFFAHFGHIFSENSLWKIMLNQKILTSEKWRKTRICYKMAKNIFCSKILEIFLYSQFRDFGISRFS